MADEIEVLGCVARRPTDTLLRELEQGDASAYGYEVREMARELLAARAALAAADALAKAVREDDDACRGGSSAPSLAVMDALALYRAARGAR